ncbi:MAG TPA: MBOAT family protein [Bacteriovoracaceae bacterium]|nr:MBOAT family protein [Bacteriovoracaceae bacterium]
MNYAKTLLLSPVIYFFTEAGGAMGQLLFSPSKHKAFPIHFHPLTASSLSQFWGHDWNIWVQDWLRDVAIKFGHGSTIKRILVTFAVSGLFHEIMVNLPYWLVYKKSYFGTMMLYFIIQSGALWVDKKFIRQYHPYIQRTYMWMALVLPSPLFINVPFLTFLGIKNG